MLYDSLKSGPSALGTQVCYFSIVPSSYHYSDETPTSTPYSEEHQTPADPVNPLLALRDHPYVPSTPLVMDASKLLQLQTAAAHSTSLSPSSSRSNSESSSPVPQTLCCCRCRRNSLSGKDMIRFGTNMYYCSHCASMVGFRG